MADPFDVLGGPDQPVAPDARFTARLRDRLERALTYPTGVTVSDLDVLHPEVLDEPPPRGRPSGPLTPYLAVADAPAAIEFYRLVFAATVTDGPIVMPDGRIGHAELTLPGGARVMLSEEHPEIGVTAPRPGAGAAVTLHLVVSDVDEVVARCFDGGAQVDRAPADNPYGRAGVIIDPFGHRWMLMAPTPPPDRREGDAGYVSLWVPDATEAAEFFAAVLGWEYQPADPAQPRSRHLVDRALHHGIQGGVDDATLFCCYAVADLDAALDRVRAAGGRAEDPTDEPWGRTATCSDDQGRRFALFSEPGVTPSAGPASGRPEAPVRQGDVAYLTYQVVDVDAFRAFFGAVLGWRFAPGATPGGWQIADVQPSSGVSGGHARATTVPMYAVDDIHAAVDRVRAAGGTAPAPERHPYGETALCSDAQGTAFYLGQLS